MKTTWVVQWNLGENVEFHLSSMMKVPADESLCKAEVARVEIMYP